MILRLDLNLPDLRTLDLRAQKPTLAAHTTKRSKYNRVLSLHVGSMSFSGRTAQSVSCSCLTHRSVCHCTRD